MRDLPPLRLLNLDRSAERLRTFGEWNAHLGKVERASAVDGSTVARAERVRTGQVASDFDGGAGSLGCALSHVRLWDEVARADRALTVFEDDIVVSHHFASAARRVMDDLPPDWDLVKWGWTPNLGAQVEIAGTRVQLNGDGKEPPRDAATFGAFQAGTVAAAPVRMLHSLGLFAYSISPAGARAALAACLPLRTGLDEALAAAYPRMRAYLCLPSLALHTYGDESVRMQLDRAARR